MSSRNEKSFLIGLFLVLCAGPLMAGGTAPEPGTCIRPLDAELADLINQYRIDNALPAIPVSTVLTTVGQWHGRDAVEHGDQIFAGACNLHSWSETRPDLWSGGCYLPDHSNAPLMWNKPSELSGGSYTATGYEIAYQGPADAKVALTLWQGSSSHNDVILNQGIWAGFPWQAMGVGMEVFNGTAAYAYVWFSTVPDPSTPLSDCAVDPLIFGDRFEMDQP